FQAEDGIRDFHVTGVQTCALPIYLDIAIPAEEAKFPFFQNICIYINHTDNLRQGYSHFLREVKNLKEVALKASEGTPIFAIFDEIGRASCRERASSAVGAELGTER